MKTESSKQTVLITGTSSGLGKTCAKYFATHGWNVIASMRQPEIDHELKLIPDVLVTALDVTEPATISKSIEMGITRFGRIDAVINNAGFGLFGVFEATPAEKVREQFEVNVFGVMKCERRRVIRSRNSFCPEEAPVDGQGRRVGEIKLHRAVCHQGCPGLEVV